MLRQEPLPAGVHPASLRASPDGALLITTGKPDAGATYRIRHAAASATARPALPAVAAGCVSDNRISPTTLGRRVVTLPTPTAGRCGSSALLDGSGTQLVQSCANNPASSTLELYGNGRTTTVYRVRRRQLYGTQADARGGAWVVSGPDIEGTSRLLHVDSSGRTRPLASGLPYPSGSSDDYDSTVRPSDGSLFWRAEGATSSPWHRTTVGGVTTTTTYVGNEPYFGGDTGYTYVGGPTHGAVHRTTATGVGVAVLGSPTGRALSVAAVVAAGLPDSDVQPTIAGVTSDGRLLILGNRYLARIEPSGHIAQLAGPVDGMPDNIDLEVVFGRYLYFEFFRTGAHIGRVEVS